MKARITIVFGTAVMALALAAGALAAPVRSLDYTRPSASIGWTSYDAFGHPLWPIIGFFGLKASDANRPGAIRPNPWGMRGSAGAFATAGWTRANS